MTDRPPKHISQRWPGPGLAGYRKAKVTNRLKKVRITLSNGCNDIDMRKRPQGRKRT